MRLFIVRVRGFSSYDGQWYCAVYAETDEQALQKAIERYPIADSNYREYKQTELTFADGVSDLLLLGL